MITGLEISNFRGFKKYTIDDIGQINLLVGTNNCGKTSILEAIRLLKSKGNPRVLFFVLARRGEQIPFESEKAPMAEADLCRFFYSYKLVPGTSFSVTGYEMNQNEQLSVSIHDVPYESRFFDEYPDFTGNYQLKTSWKKGRETVTGKYPVSQNGGLSYDYIRRMRPIRSKSVERDNLEFVPTASLSPQKVISLFDEIVLSPDEELVLEALNIIEPDIVRIASLGPMNYKSLRSEEYARGGILVKSAKWEKRIPIGSLGDGIWRILGLILSLIGSKGGILLIDEIDTGLHHGVMSQMWKLICKTAQKLDVQVFATTHSSDCWKSLAEKATNSEFDNTKIRIHRIDRHKNKPETFTNQEMEIALYREIEVR